MSKKQKPVEPPKVTTYPWAADESGRIDQKEAEKALDEAKADAHRWELRFQALKKIAAEEITTSFEAGAIVMREEAAKACKPLLRSMASRSELAEAIRALPLPKEDR